jgi:hypothetical protein
MRRLVAGDGNDDEGEDEGCGAADEDDEEGEEVALPAHGIWSGPEKLLILLVALAATQSAKDEEHDGIGPRKEGEEVHALPGFDSPVTHLCSVLPGPAQKEKERDCDEREDQGAEEHRRLVAPRRREEGGAEDDDDEIALPAHAERSGPLASFHGLPSQGTARRMGGSS